MRRAVDATLSAQRELGHLEPIDAAFVGLARTLADAIDAELSDPDGRRYTVGALAGRLMPVLLELRGSHPDTDPGPDDDMAAILGALRDAPQP